MKSVLTFSVVLALLLPTVLQGQTPPVAADGKKKPLPPTKTLDPRDGFGAVYGTDNLAKPGKAQKSPAAGTDQKPLAALTAEEYKALQEMKTQPPADFAGFVEYLSNQPLLAKLALAISKNPKIDASYGIVAAWNDVALDMTSIDHTTAGKKIKGRTIFEDTYGEQFGPPRASRAMAIVQLAVFEALNTIDERYESYKGAGNTLSVRKRILKKLPAGTTPGAANAALSAAVNQAAFDTLLYLYPGKRKLLEAAHLRISILVAASEGAKNIDAPKRIKLGEDIGRFAAAVVIAERQSDGSQEKDPTRNRCLGTRGVPPAKAVPAPLCFDAYFPDTVPLPIGTPLLWTVDPVKPNPVMLGSTWHLVKPFVVKAHQFVNKDGIVLSSGLRKKPVEADFEKDLKEAGYGPTMPDPHGGAPIPYTYGVKRVGAAMTPDRSEPQTIHAQFWGYDATALLCAPPRLYNMIATSLLYDYINKPAHPKFDVDHAAVDGARYLAVVNMALADAAIAAWEAKFDFMIARPITYIEIKDGLAPGGPGGWLPLGQVASNGTQANTTPPFPAWPSGHAVFGGALFETISRALDWDKDTGGEFTFTSDEYNGKTFDQAGNLRPQLPQHFVSLRTAEWENAESRIFIGVHWQRDGDDGIALGNEIGTEVATKALQRLP